MTTLFGLLGGLSLFIYGMNQMSEALQKTAGNKMKKILSLFTSHPIKGVLSGTLVTAVLQSSSATTVMAIGFVNARLMSLPQAISVIMGANIGTTITAQIIAFNMNDFVYPILFIGFILHFMVKKETLKNIGLGLFAFGVLFLGIQIMGNTMKPLAQSPVFVSMLDKVKYMPLLGVLVGVVMTLIVQSSSATIAVLQNFASQANASGQSVMGLSGAIPVLLGDNIGTTITAFMASIGGSVNAKRTALAHTLFNASGTILFLFVIKPFTQFIQWISPSGHEVEVISRQIANAHTLFNIIMTLLWIPFIWLMVKIVTKLIPDQKDTTCSLTCYLDESVKNQSVVALSLIQKESMHFASYLENILQSIHDYVTTPQEKHYSLIHHHIDEARALYKEIVRYITSLFSLGHLTKQQAKQASYIVYSLSELDRVRHLSHVMIDTIYEDYQTCDYSKEAQEEILEVLQLIQDMYGEVYKILNKDQTSRKMIYQLKEQITLKILSMQKKHLYRLSIGTCDQSHAISYNDLIGLVDRIANNCINIIETSNKSHFESLKVTKSL